MSRSPGPSPGGVALVTGCSRGIGHAAALRLAREGYRVVATLRGEEGREALTAAGAHVAQVDVRDAGQVEAAVAETIARFGRLDAVIANAGQGLFGCFEDVSAEQAEALLDVNVHGVLRTARAALPHLRASRGALLVISSIAGRRSAPGSSLYNASKFALEGWGEALAFELAPFGVRMVLVEPGPTESGFASSAGQGARVGEGPYAEITARLRALRGQAMGSPAPVSAVTDAIIAALKHPDPPLRWPTGPGTSAQILAARVLPWRLYRAIVTRKIRLPKP